MPQTQMLNGYAPQDLEVSSTAHSFGTTATDVKSLTCNCPFCPEEGTYESCSSRKVSACTTSPSQWCQDQQDCIPFAINTQNLGKAHSTSHILKSMVAGLEHGQVLVCNRPHDHLCSFYRTGEGTTPSCGSRT